MRRITINISDDSPTVSVRETDIANTWELEWSSDLTEQYTRRILSTAETVVLQNGGERLVFTCMAEQEAMRAQLERWRPDTVSNEGDHYAIELITAAEDGLVHNDEDFRTPLQKMTCPTCVDNIAQSRSRRREEALRDTEGATEIAKHSRLVAESYTRLAEVEAALGNRRAARAG